MMANPGKPRPGDDHPRLLHLRGRLPQLRDGLRGGGVVDHVPHRRRGDDPLLPDPEPMGALPMRGRKAARRAGVYLGLVAGGVAMMLPFLWMLSTSLKTRAEVFVTAPLSFPTGLHWENYAKMWFAMPGVTFGTFFQNSHRDRIAGNGRPGRHLCDGRIRVRGVRVPRQADPVRLDPRDPDHPVPDRPRPELHPLPLPPVAPERERQLHRDKLAAVGLGVLRRSVRDVPAAAVLPDHPQRAGRRGARRRGKPVADLHGASTSRSRDRPSPPSRSSSSCGAGTTCSTR